MNRAHVPGFTLLEIVIVLAIIGLIATVIGPNLMRMLPGSQRKEFVANINSLTQRAWQNAIATGKNQKIVFNLEKRFMQLMQETDSKDEKGAPAFKDAPSSYIKSRYSWKPNIVWKNFYINEKDQLQAFGAATETVSVYVSSQGMVQPFIINLVDIKDRGQDPEGRQISLVVNPFSGQLREYKTFQRP